MRFAKVKEIFGVVAKFDKWKFLKSFFGPVKLKLGECGGGWGFGHSSPSGQQTIEANNAIKNH